MLEQRRRRRWWWRRWLSAPPPSIISLSVRLTVWESEHTRTRRVMLIKGRRTWCIIRVYIYICIYCIGCFKINGNLLNIYIYISKFFIIIVNHKYCWKWLPSACLQASTRLIRLHRKKESFLWVLLIFFSVVFLPTLIPGVVSAAWRGQQCPWNIPRNLSSPGKRKRGDGLGLTTVWPNKTVLKLKNNWKKFMASPAAWARAGTDRRAPNYRFIPRYLIGFFSPGFRRPTDEHRPVAACI